MPVKVLTQNPLFRLTLTWDVFESGITTDYRARQRININMRCIWIFNRGMVEESLRGLTLTWDVFECGIVAIRSWTQID